MTELELTRSANDRRLYVLEGAGTLRLEGLFSRSATAEAGGESWHLTRCGFWQRVMQATDAAGSVAGTFVPRGLRRGGTLRWGGRALILRPASHWRQRYALADEEREIVVLDGKRWGRRPVSVTILDRDGIEPGLLLFASFVVRQLAVNAAHASAAGSSAGVSGASG